MIFLKSLATAFLMYSRIPMPRIEWREENRRYALCCFPAVGVVIAALFLLWRRLCASAEIGTLLNSAVCAALPVLVTGGIHLDGFCDVSDAAASNAEKERRLEILGDPRIGAFAAIKLGIYLVLQFALFSELEGFGAELIAALGFVLSRALSGIAAVVFRNAKRAGSLWAFSETAHRSVTLTVLGVVTAVCAVAMIAASPVCGAAALLAALAAFVFYRFYAYKTFGGITGDTAGWFLQICELAVLAGCVFGEKIIGGALWF